MSTPPHNRFSYGPQREPAPVRRPEEFGLREVPGHLVGARVMARLIHLFGPPDIGDRALNRYSRALVGTRYDPEYRRAVRAARRSGRRS